LKEEKLILDSEIVEMFRNSLLICDEIHHTYNSQEKNNWGVALGLILEKEDELNLRTIFLSATTINNSPSEVVDLIRLLLPKNKFDKNDFFDKK
jgi:hypothetical protein